MKKVDIFTDGACKGNPGPGGWGCILKQNGTEREIKGSHPNTTNNIMEMTAAVKALEALDEPSDVTLTTDSDYLVKGMTQWIHNWKKKNWVTASKQPVKNKDIWLELERLSKIHQVKWKWVRGHSGHPENERCDQLANEAISEIF